MREFAKDVLSFENAQNSEFAQCASLLNNYCSPCVYVSRDLKLVTQLSPKVTQYRTLFEKIAKNQDMDLVRVLRKGVRSSPLAMF